MKKLLKLYESILAENNLFDYQNSNQEKVIHALDWNYGNVYRYVLEGTGDIFRELTKQRPYYDYIQEKIRRIKNQIEKEQSNKTGSEGSFKFSYEYNKKKFEQMIKQWEKQPFDNDIQKTAIDLNIAMLKGNFVEAKKLINIIEKSEK